MNIVLFSAFKNTLSNESQNAQQHRAEIDFEMSSVKEKIDVLDQGDKTRQSYPMVAICWHAHFVNMIIKFS